MIMADCCCFHFKQTKKKMRLSQAIWMRKKNDTQVYNE